MADRVVQAALKLVLEPIFEADFEPVSYGFRPKRRAHDAIAEIHLFGTQGYRWVLDADIEACFDSIDHTALMDRVRRAGQGQARAGAGQGVPQGRDPHRARRRTRTPITGTPQGGILSPLLANIALSVLDEHLHAAVAAGRDDGHVQQPRTDAGAGTCRTGGSSATRTTSSSWCTAPATDVEALREEIAQVLAPLGLRLSPAKTRIVHMSDGFDFLGFHIQWRRKRGTNKWYVYTFIADRPIRSVKAKIRALTHRTSQQNPRDVLIRLNQIMRGWANYFKHAVGQAHLQHAWPHFIWWRVSRWLRTRHRWKWKDVRRWLTTPNGRWRPITADGIELFNLDTVPVTRYRYRGNKIPNPWTAAQPRPTADTVESPVR